MKEGFHISLLSLDPADRAAWRMALQSIGGVVRDASAIETRGEASTFCVLVIPPYTRRTKALAVARLASTRTLLVCDNPQLAAQVSACLPHPTLVTTTACAHDFLHLQLPLLRDMSGGCLWYVGPRLAIASDAGSSCVLASPRGRQ